MALPEQPTLVLALSRRCYNSDPALLWISGYLDLVQPIPHTLWLPQEPAGAGAWPRVAHSQTQPTHMLRDVAAMFSHVGPHFQLFYSPVGSAAQQGILLAPLSGLLPATDLPHVGDHSEPVWHGVLLSWSL